jgi:membrane protease subunit HflK
MAWQDEQSPWGKGGRTPSPEDFIAELLKKLKQTFGGGGSGAPPGEEGGETPVGGPPKGLFGGIGKLFIIMLLVIVIQAVSSASVRRYLRARPCTRKKVMILSRSC